MSETNALLRQLLEEIKGLRESSEAVEESTAESVKEERAVNIQSATRTVASGLNNATAAINALNSGDVRDVGAGALTTAATVAGGVVGGPAGAAIGATAGAAVGELVKSAMSLTAPRGYNKFSMNEEFDRTRVNPFKQMEQIYAKFQRHGVDFSLDAAGKQLDALQRLEEKEFEAVKRFRKRFGERTVQYKTYAEAGQAYLGGMKRGAEELLGFVPGDSKEKKTALAMSQRKMNQAIERQNKFDNF